jgi:spore coat polysaccharide biosynthesis protein SpsF
MKGQTATHHESPIGRVVGLVQARMNSARLPGKMLEDLCGHPLLHWVIARAKRARRLDAVILATTTSKLDDPLTDLAARLDVQAYRGSEHDVLSRLTRAARDHRAVTAVRICADNPLVAPEEIDRLIDTYRLAIEDGARRNKLYVSNARPLLGNRYPDGLGAEVLSVELLAHLDATATSPHHREHVTAMLLESAADFDVRVVQAPAEIADPDIRLDIDTPEDLEAMRRLCRGLSLDSTPVEIVHAYRTQHRGNKS